MRSPIVVCLAASLTVALAASCGGSASESPWPVEPEHREGAPVGEVATAGAPMEERTPESRGEVSANGPRRRAEPDAGVAPLRPKP